MGSTQVMADEIAKIDQKFFESLVAEIKKSIQQTRKDVDLHNVMLQQLRKDVLKNSEDWINERDQLKDEKNKLQIELNNCRNNLN